MIKANELRIGNLVYFENLESGLFIHDLPIEDGIEINSIYDGNLIVKPIPLNNEWLIKLGFTRLPNQLTWGLTGRYFVVKSYDGFNINVGLDKILLLTKSIKYVHQLQNIFFALTEKELEIK